MSPRLLTADEVRDVLGPKALGKSDDDLLAIARRIRVVSTALIETVAEKREV